MSEPSVIAETSRLTLRPWKASDREPFFQINSDPRVMEYFPSLMTREESDDFADRIEAHFSSHGFGLCAAELKQARQFIGYVGIWVPTFHASFTPCVEIGWRLAADFWGQGLATEAAERILQYGFETIDLTEIVSFTVPANIGSRRVMEKIGMTRDEGADFDHPRLPEGHPLRRHVLYRIKRADWLKNRDPK